MKFKTVTFYYYKDLSLPSMLPLKDYTLHRENGPAIIRGERLVLSKKERLLHPTPDEDPVHQIYKVFLEEYWINGEPRTKEYFKKEINKNGSIEKSYYYPRNKGCEESPIVTVNNISEKIITQYYGKSIDYYHRETGPAMIIYKGLSKEKIKEVWLLDNLVHRESDDPAYIEKENGITYVLFCKHGLLHRDHGSAYFEYHNDFLMLERWYKDDFIHREDGPAEFIYDRSSNIKAKNWYLEGLAI